MRGMRSILLLVRWNYGMEVLVLLAYYWYKRDREAYSRIGTLEVVDSLDMVI